MLIGVHAGTSGGLAAAVRYAASVGCECLQIFAKSPMRWHGPRPADSEIEDLRATLAEMGFGPLVTHTAYLLNLSGPDQELRERSWRALADELCRGEALGAVGVVTHVGNHPDGDADAASRRLADSIARARQEAACGVPVLLENSAGAGSLFLASIDHFERAFAAIDEAAGTVGICVDTCHAHAAGIPVSSAEDWRGLLDGLDLACGHGRVTVVHANDCVAALGSKKDRHAWIGDGAIGESGFAAMFAEPRLAGACVITEMPGEAPEKDAINVERLRGLRQRAF